MPNFHLGIFEILSLSEEWRTETFSLKQKLEIKRKHSKKSFPTFFFPIMKH